MGYPGKRKQIARLVAHLRKQTKAGVTDFSAHPQGVTLRAARSLLMHRPGNLTRQQEQALIELRDIHPEIKVFMQLVECFVQMLRSLHGQQLENWLQRAQQNTTRKM
jgi:hypothetical protein